MACGLVGSDEQAIYINDGLTSLVCARASGVEYSRLMHENEEAALATLSGHRAIIDDLIAVWRGKVTGSAGDSVLAEFASVIDAVNCGVAIQQAIAVANSALVTGRQMELRIGINVGDIMVQDGDVFGDGVNVAARLESLAQPGGICVTRAKHSSAAAGFPTGVRSERATGPDTDKYLVAGANACERRSWYGRHRTQLLAIG